MSVLQLHDAGQEFGELVLVEGAIVVAFDQHELYRLDALEVVLGLVFLSISLHLSIPISRVMR